MQEVIEVQVDKYGRRYISLPGWICEILYKASGIKSRKLRHIKKAIKKQFHVVIGEYLENTKCSK